VSTLQEGSGRGFLAWVRPPRVAFRELVPSGEPSDSKKNTTVGTGMWVLTREGVSLEPAWGARGRRGEEKIDVMGNSGEIRLIDQKKKKKETQVPVATVVTNLISKLKENVMQVHVPAEAAELTRYSNHC
jgi:hypothetical protein